MSTITQKPILHGRDHCPGGADPIPCMIGAPAGDFEGILLATGPYAYWRLGEASTPWADTSGFAPAADLTSAGSGTAFTPDVTGALPVGLDDGAVEFNYDGTSPSGGRYLVNSGGGKDFNFTGGEVTACAWVKVKASAGTRRGGIVGNVTWSSGGSRFLGFGLEVVYPARTIRFTRGDDGPGERYATTSTGVTAGEWVFVAGTYDAAEIKLYVNAELQDTTADTSGGALSAETQIWIGYGGEGVGVDSWLYGTVDEAALWDRALSSAEISAIYTAGVEGAGAGYVLTADGLGGTIWAAPTIEVEF